MSTSAEAALARIRILAVYAALVGIVGRSHVVPLRYGHAAAVKALVCGLRNPLVIVVVDAEYQIGRRIVVGDELVALVFYIVLFAL